MVSGPGMAVGIGMGAEGRFLEALGRFVATERLRGSSCAVLELLDLGLT